MILTQGMLSTGHLAYLGSALQQLRLASGFSQAEICAHTGLGRPQLSRWENNHDVPTLESLIKYLSAIDVGLTKLELTLLGMEEEERASEVHRVVREIRAGHTRHIESRSGVRRAVGMIMRPNPEGLEWQGDVTKEMQTDGGTVAADHEGDASWIQVPEMERLVAGLPETLESLLAEPAAQHPAGVDWLLERGWTMHAAGDPASRHVADAGRLLAAELPQRFSRDQRFSRRARSLELWGAALRAVGESTGAEAALLCGFELLAQTSAVEPSDLAVLLGRLARVASDHERASDLALYGAAAVRIARAADRDWPLPVFLRLWQTVMTDGKQPASSVRIARALFQAQLAAYGGFEDQPWEMWLDVVDRGDAGTEIRLERRGPRASRPSAIVEEPVVYLCGG